MMDVLSYLYEIERCSGRRATRRSDNVLAFATDDGVDVQALADAMRGCIQLLCAVAEIRDPRDATLLCTVLKLNAAAARGGPWLSLAPGTAMLYLCEELDVQAVEPQDAERRTKPLAARAVAVRARLADALIST
jgi:hypothetical protein